MTNAANATGDKTAPPLSKPRRGITANQVTMLRILALPIPCWALIARPPQPWMWVAFVFGALVGATDFVDGWLARRDGPTILGSLLDPVADKLFIAMLLLPLVASGDCPTWAAGLLFVRELLITSLRTSLSVRQQHLKTSQLGKLKTVVQMGGIATFFITVFVPRPIMPTVQLACTAGMAALFVLFAVRGRKFPPVWLTGGTLMWLGVYVVCVLLEPAEAAFWQFVAMVALTWVSGADYLWGAWRRLKDTGGISRADALRTVWSIVHGMALIPVLAEVPALVVPVIAAVCAELSFGGIENGVAAERGRFSRGSVLPSTLAALVAGALAWGGLRSMPLLVVAWALAALCIVNAAVAFWLERDVFLNATDRPIPPQEA